MSLSKSIKLSFLTLMTVGVAGIGTAEARSPTVIEVFGKNACDADTEAQDEIFEILQNSEDVILVNCRRYFDGDIEDHRYTLNYCNDRAREYSTKFGYAGIKTPMVVINGRWDANRKSVSPAVKLGKTDDVAQIEMALHENFINIEVPEVKSDTGFGSLFLYAYLPTQGGKKLVVDPDVELTEEVKTKIRLKQSVPFVQEVHKGNFYLRPVLAPVKIGYWAGEKMSLSYPLTDLTALAGNRINDVSYVVVLQEGGDYGSVIAAGEIMSHKEMALSLPKSEPLEVELISTPTANTISIQ